MFRSTLFVLLTTMTLTAAHAGWGPNNEDRDWGGDQTSQADSLTTLESQNLLYLREEEKVARDVYDVMHDRWGLYIFNNISSAEQNHMDAVLMQLNQYGLVDPAQQPGVFSDQELQNLYDTLVMQGNESLLNALLTGALIEEVDMQDLNEMIASSQNAVLISMYERLLCGSRNHLRAFVSQIENRGLVYEAQVLEQEAVDQIVDTPMERRCGQL
jgi:hypothetical protein